MSLKKADIESLQSQIDALQKRNEQLKKENEFFEQIFVQNITSTQILDKEGWCVRINKKLSKLFGVEPEHIEGKKYNILQDGEIIKTGVINHLKKTFDNQESVSWEVNFDIGHASDTTGVEVKEKIKKWFYNRAYPIFDENNVLKNVIVQHEDITDRKIAELNLISEKKRYQNLLDTLSEGIWKIDKNGVTSYVNINMAEMLGYTIEEMIGKHLFEFMDEQGQKIAEQNIEKRKQGLADQHDFEFRHKDGKCVYTLMVTKPMFDEDGNYDGAIAGILDITERRNAEKELELKEKFLENLNDIAYTTDTQGNVTYVNPAIERIAGLKVADVINKPFVPQFIKENHLSLIDVYQRSLNGEHLDNILTFLNGAVCQFTSLPLKNDRNEIIGTFGIAKDISDKILAEKALKVSEKKYRSMFENMTSGFALHELILDSEYNPTDLKFIDANREFLKIFELSFDRILGKKIRDIKPYLSKELFELFIETAINNTEILLEQYYPKLGKYLELRAFAPTEGQLAVIYNDITNKKKIEKDLIAEKEKAQHYLDIANVIIVALDTNANVMLINRKGLEMLGYQESELIGRNWFEICLPVSDREMVKNVFSDIMSNRIDTKNMLSFENKIISKSGEEFLIKWNNAFLLGDDGNFRGSLSSGQDISAERTALTALERSERAYRSYIDNAPDGIFVANEKGQYTEVNKAAQEMTGYSKEELLNLSIPDLTYPDDTEAGLAHFNKVLTEGHAIGELRFRRKNGQISWWIVSAVLLSEKEVIGFAKDITDYRLSEEKALSLGKIFENSLNEIYIFDIERYRFIDVNRGARQNLGYTLEELKELTPIDIKPEMTFEEFDSIMKELKSGNKEIAVLSTKHRRKDGTKYDIEAHVQLSTYQMQDVYVAFVMDVTEREKALEALKNSERIHRYLIESVNAVPFTFNLRTGKFTYVGKQIEDMTGYSPESWTNFEVWASRIHADDRDRAASFCLNETKLQRDHEFEYTGIRADGKHVHIREYVSVISRNGKPFELIGFMFDVTETKKAERELQKLSKLENLGTLAGGIAHNFKNILASMSFNLSLAKYKPENSKEYLEKLEKGMSQATALATRFQTFSIGGDPIIETFDLRDVIHDSVDMGLSGSQISAETIFEDDLFSAEADSKQINEVLMNLIINAKQAMPDGGKIKISCSNYSAEKINDLNLITGNYIKISVKDQGIGISREQLPKIFDPFYTTKSEGQGLGLSTIQYIIRKHRGTITVDSEIDKGTEFCIYIPASRNIGNREDTQGTMLRKGDNKRILFMDDNESIRESMVEIGELLGYEIETAANGYETIDMYLESIKSTKYYAVILDLTIQGSDLQGEDVMKKLLAIDPDIKAVVFSGHSTKPIVANYQQYKFAARLDKPVTVESVSKVLGSL